MMLFLLRLDNSFGDRPGHSLDSRLDVIAHVVRDVLRHWGRLPSYVALECAQVAEHAHGNADEQQWHAYEGTPEVPRRFETAEGCEEATDSDDKEEQAGPGDRWTAHAEH